MIDPILEYRLLVYVTDDSNHGDHYLKFKAVVVTFEGGKIRNPDSRDPYGDLQVTAQIDGYQGKHQADFYGRHLGYSSFRVELADAERMVKTLRRLHKRLDALDEKFGTATDMAAFVGRVTDALGAKAIGRPAQEEGSSYDENEYRWGTVNDLRYWLRLQIDNWAEKYGLVLATEV
jgi:hypothetical protein